jgi:heme/copper-type cytochrome/quinol oxidase subunit 4
MPGVYELIVIFGAFAVMVLLNVIPFWMICTKAGFPGALSLLMLVPIANVVLLFYIAFAEWPAHRQNLESYGQ